MTLTIIFYLIFIINITRYVVVPLRYGIIEINNDVKNDIHIYFNFIILCQKVDKPSLKLFPHPLHTMATMTCKVRNQKIIIRLHDGKNYVLKGETISGDILQLLSLRSTVLVSGLQFSRITLLILQALHSDATFDSRIFSSFHVPDCQIS